MYNVFHRLARLTTVVFVSLKAVDVNAQTPFSTTVVDYRPAAGQFVQNPAFNDPQRALGPPVGGGTTNANLSSLATLGGAGGSITLAFDHVVTDDPLNPYGMDAIVFGNALWAGSDSDRHYAEPAVIEICLDESGSDCAGGPWYLIPGSHIDDPAASWSMFTWDDDTNDATFPPALASWVPSGVSNVWHTQGFMLPLDPFRGNALRIVTNPLAGTGFEGIFGYAEYTPTRVLGDQDGDDNVDDIMITPESFYTVPDNPFLDGISPFSGGGDAFDIGWAIDPDTGAPAGLTGFNVIRLTTAVDWVAGPLGEISAEIDAVADVAPDATGDANQDGDVDLLDVAEGLACFGDAVASDVCATIDRDGDGVLSGGEMTYLITRMTGPGE